MFEKLAEELKKASDRIKSGIKTKRHDEKLSARDMHNALGALLNDPKIAPAAKQHLAQAHKAIGEKAEKEDAMKARAAFKVKDFDPGKAEEEKSTKKQADKTQYDSWMEQNQPKKIDKLGGQKQYEQDVNHPKMRSKAAEATSSGVKDKLMGENVAIRDKSYGQGLDAQAQLKAKAAKIQEAKGPSDVIRVSNAPNIPDEHKNDMLISSLMSVRPSMKDSSHVEAIDNKINDRVKELSSSPMKKSISYSNNGQWQIK